jgi:hypothetical protein
MTLTCPRCGWENVRPSIRNGVADHLAAALLLRPYRCRSCRDRFYRYSGFAKKWKLEPEPTPMMPPEWPPALAPARKAEARGIPPAAELAWGISELNWDPKEAPARPAPVPADAAATRAPLCKLIFARPSSEQHR